MPRDRFAPTVRELEGRTYLSAAPLATQLVTQVVHEFRIENAAIIALNDRLRLEEKAEARAEKTGSPNVSRLAAAISTTNNDISILSTQSNTTMDTLQMLADNYDNDVNEISSFLEAISGTQGTIASNI